VAVCRAALFQLGTERITLGSVYSDTAAVTSCSRQSQYVKSVVPATCIVILHLQH